MLNDYLLGILYGDGHFKQSNFMFTTTHKALSDKVRKFLDENEFSYYYYVRSFEEGHEKENYETLEIIEVVDKNFIDLLEQNGFKSDVPSERVRITPQFIRGYIETKGTLFRSQSRENEFWRISISGRKEDISYIKENLENYLNISFSNIVRRKEREKLGIISNSYRINIQNRNGLAKLIDFIDGEDMTEYLKNRVEGFKHFHKTKLFNTKRVFKHYKNAVNVMAKELGIAIKGVRGGGGKRGWKPVYLWEDGIKTKEFKGWDDAYNWIKKVYTEQTEKNVPIVEEQ